MDRELNPRPSATSVSCNNSNCTFFGSAATEGFCSVCYQKELQRRKQSISEAADIAQNMKITPKLDQNLETEVFENDKIKNEHIHKDTMETDELEVNLPAVSSSSKSDENKKPKKPKKAKCGVCKKKLGLTGFECRCGKLFCAIHRYSDKHDCNFDYEKLGKDLLRKANQVVVDAKIEKI